MGTVGSHPEACLWRIYAQSNSHKATLVTEQRSRADWHRFNHYEIRAPLLNRLTSNPPLCTDLTLKKRDATFQTLFEVLMGEALDEINVMRAVYHQDILKLL